MNTTIRNRESVQTVVLLAVAMLLLQGGAVAASPFILRPPSAMGTYYPTDPETLLKTVQGYFDAADAPELQEPMIACIASPGPYGLAGAVTAHAFKNLKPGQYDRVVILSAAHMADIENCSVEAVDAFVTPLGPVPLDVDALRQLLFSPLFTARTLTYRQSSKKPMVHEYEYGVEALLPYLQERLHEFKLVPILVGRLEDGAGKFSPAAVDAVARVLKPIITERTLVVASSSFTHFGNDFSNRPFNDNIIANIEHLDREAFDCLLAMDMKCFVGYLDKSHNVIDGRHPIEIMLRLLPPQAQARILAYEVSAAKTGELNRSVSYAAFTFHDPARPQLEARPDKVRPLPLRPVKPAQDSQTPAAPAQESASGAGQTPQQNGDAAKPAATEAEKPSSAASPKSPSAKKKKAPGKTP